MDVLFLATLIATGVFVLNAKQQRERVALLASYLGNYQIEKLMENLTEGYLRALGESDTERREQVWSLLRTTELQLSEQFTRFTADFTRVEPLQTRISTLPLALPYADRWLPSASIDMRQALAIHAQGIERAVRNEAGLSLRDKAYTLSAELFLMQHTCHWFCKSRAIASARLMARHKTPHAQVLASVTPATRTAYLALLGG
ncbi:MULTISPECIES: hypothetical protein [unclassified Simplicispira]|jgi:hypothetical protein|uniref:hypothetical protein n=1 Tax=unclassified Simplicispira TaxID=2630407 RepID=UPI000D5D3B8F|nr:MULTISPECIES: hypothetical protein [unclassified Simplicispira]MBH1978936.1 hypothetical protein [Comamonadaceae bacterium]PVY56669.1 hypothetical protein C8D04_1932 [Simplicispira sp. 125]REG17613.1 hypothetical protein C8D01_2242 [Simplicispira sp. 110]